MRSTASEPEHLGRILHTVAHLLPAQGPIGVFIHHNTLHAFQHLPFEKAVVEAARLFQAEPYLSEAEYREAFASGRIRRRDIEAVLQAEGRDISLRRTVLLAGLRSCRPETIRWEIAENGRLDSFRKDLPAAARERLKNASARELFRFWSERTPLPAPPSSIADRPRDGVMALLGLDIDDFVNPLLIKLSGAFLDQGMAYWPMPNREEGFWRAVIGVLRQHGGVNEGGLRDLPRWVRTFQEMDATSAVQGMLTELSVEEPDWESVIEAELLALPGWAGLMHQLELDPGLAPHEPVPASLLDFLAVRLLLVLAATSSAITGTKGWRVRLDERADLEARRLTTAAQLFEASQLAGYGPGELAKWTEAQLDEFRRSASLFDDWERRRVWHTAYELRHERRILLPLQQFAAGQTSAAATDRLAAQVFFCIDDREESIRRHLEEIDPEIETFGAAGFFGVAMNYTGLDDARGVSMCPIVVKPQHAVEERPAAGQEQYHGRRLALRRARAALARQAFVSSRTLFRGWIGTTILGIFSVFPLAARVLSPRRYARWMRWLNASVLPEPRTELSFARPDEAGPSGTEGLLPGFTIAEKADRIANVLGPAGLTKGMAKLVVVLGHGSSSLNNPHRSAYDCGACGGRRGGPNARIFAAMANRPEVRRQLRERGILVPEDTWFVGGYHDTCNDNIDFYDLAALPASHEPDLERVAASLDSARAASAHERSRRFENAAPGRRTQDGLHHVQERAEHLAEPRPEYGHSTNAVCIVGRRSATRGLFLDRRSFLVSYDATLDPGNTSLAQLLAAVVPVCAGISLEYYFSRVDNERYGCGTKLPHNIAGLMGVMNGCESDLRTGLTWQMVEIHEPVRILFVVETTTGRVLETFRQNPLLWEFLANRWIRLAAQDPIDGRIIHMYRGDGKWEKVEGDDEKLAQAPSSLDWYHGHREHLALARILTGSPA